MAAEVAPDFLEHEVGRFRSQHGARAPLMGLQLVEGTLDLPALGVGGREIESGDVVGVEDGGEEPVGLVVVVSVVDPVVDRRGWSAAGCCVVQGRSDGRSSASQEAVSQGLDRTWLHDAVGPPQEISPRGKGP